MTTATETNDPITVDDVAVTAQDQDLMIWMSTHSENLDTRFLARMLIATMGQIEDSQSVGNETDKAGGKQDWRIGKAVTPKTKGHPHFCVIFVVRAISDDGKTLIVETYSPSDNYNVVKLEEPFDDWVTA